GAPQPALTTDAQNPQPAGAAFNLSWTIQNWASGMTASLASDKDIGDGKGTDPQDVTSAVQSDGSGTVAIKPPGNGAFNAGTFNYALTVTPQSGGPATAKIAMTVGAASQTALATLQIQAEGGSPGAQVASDFEKPLTLTWKVTGASSAQLTTDLKAAGTSFEGTTGEGGELRMAVDLASALP